MLASLPPTATRKAQRQATLDAFIALLSSNHHGSSSFPDETEGGNGTFSSFSSSSDDDDTEGEDGMTIMRSLVVTDGDGRRHYGFAQRGERGKGKGQVRVCV